MEGGTTTNFGINGYYVDLEIFLIRSCPINYKITWGWERGVSWDPEK